MTAESPPSTSDLRARLRRLRRELDPAERAVLSRRIAALAFSLAGAAAARRIAVFASVPDEPDTAELMRRLRGAGAQLFLPRVRDYRRHILEFVACEGALRANRYGIREPGGGRRLAARWLDLAFVPLVGFDGTGARIGMGAGYYDRAFAFRRRRLAWRGPRLVGLAFACQEAEHIEAAPHDIRLDAIVTENGVKSFEGVAT